MKKLQFLLVLVTAIGATGFPSAPPVSAQGIYFDDSDPDLMRLGNNYWEIGLRKYNGGIAYLVDKATGQSVSDGSLNGCLWVVVFDCQTPNEYVESCSYGPGLSNHFSYEWSPVDHRLALRYDPDPAASRSVAATVTVTASSDHWLDLHLVLHNDWGYVPDDIKFPADLVFKRSSIQEVLLPVLPGVVLEAGFFGRGLAFEHTYPGLMVSDFVAVSFTPGRFAMYSIDASDRVVPTRLGFCFDHCAGSATTCLTHNLESGVGNGAT